MNRAEKEQAVGELQGELANAVSILLTDLSGVDVETVNALRSQFRERGIKCKVAKNTLIKLAVKETPAEAMNPLLVGPTALIWHNEEPAIGAKLLKDFFKENKETNLSVKGGYIDGDIFDGEDGLKLADMLGKDDLRAQILGLIEKVPGTFLALLNTPARQFLGVMEARKKKLEDEGGA
jgi:large subunit ribosomal protein L10